MPPRVNQWAGNQKLLLCSFLLLISLLFLVLLCSYISSNHIIYFRLFEICINGIIHCIFSIWLCCCCSNLPYVHKIHLCCGTIRFPLLHAILWVHHNLYIHLCWWVISTLGFHKIFLWIFLCTYLYCLLYPWGFIQYSFPSS